MSSDAVDDMAETDFVEDLNMLCDGFVMKSRRLL